MPQAAALLLKPPVTVTVLCFLLPDLVDKPLWALGVGCGRYVAHTLLFVFLVSLAFALKKRAYGVFALFGGMLHLLSDIGWFIPWLYPFVRYDFPQLEFTDTISWSMVVGELLEALVIVLAISLVLWLSSRCKKQGRQVAVHSRETDGT